MFFKAADKVAAVRKACLQADKREIMIGKEQIFLGLKYPHELDIFLTAHAVLLPEFRCEARIAHMTLFGNIGNTDIFLKPAVDIFRDVLYAIDLCRADRTVVYIQSYGYPMSDDAEDEPLDVRSKHNISSVQVLPGFPYTVGKNLTAVQHLGLLGIKMYLHFL